ncbi:MAG: hypothetical protein FJW31_25840 [Acidobacteria bacterium]|nr:hypothetical protein [Acidobacteriota bacterium]
MRWSEFPEWRTLRDGGRPLAERAGYLPAGSWLHERCRAVWAARPAPELMEAAGIRWRAHGDLLVEGEPEAAPNAALPEEFATPDVHTIPDLAAFTGLGREQLAKSVVTMAADALVFCFVRGDHQLDDAKLARHLGVETLRGATADEIVAAFGAEPGSLGPVGVKGCRVVVDLALVGATGLVTGANRTGFHLRHVTPVRDFACEFADIRKGGRARVLADADSGLRITEFLEAAIERHQDAAGVRLPAAIAPFAAVVTLVNPADAAQCEAAGRVYGELREASVEVVLDDRAERAGVKFNDAELIGFPLRITAGKNVRDGMLEIVDRATRAPVSVPVAEAAARVLRRGD